MAAGEYLKVAAANLRRAAQARKAEADEARRTVIRTDQETQSEVSSITNQIRLLQVQLSKIEEQAQKSIVYNQIRNLQSKIDELKQQAERHKQQIAQDAGNKEGDVNGLNSQASDLERRAGQ